MQTPWSSLVVVVRTAVRQRAPGLSGGRARLARESEQDRVAGRSGSRARRLRAGRSGRCSWSARARTQTRTGSPSARFCRTRRPCSWSARGRRRRRGLPGRPRDSATARRAPGGAGTGPRGPAGRRGGRRRGGGVGSGRTHWRYHTCSTHRVNKGRQREAIRLKRNDSIV